MANSRYFFHAAVVELLSRAPQLAEADRAALTGDDIPQSLVAATKILNNLLQPPRVVVDVDPDGGGNDYRADRTVDLVELRRGQNDFEPEEMFKVTVGEKTRDVVGYRETIIRDSGYVAHVFEATTSHARAQAWREEAARADRPSRQFRIEWLEGYDPTPPQIFPLISFDPGLDRGFTFDDADALLNLQLGCQYESAGATDRVRITRTR